MQNNILEIAQKFGVPLPQTCKTLDWQNETSFYWVFKRLESQYIANHFEKSYETALKENSFILCIWNPANDNTLIDVQSKNILNIYSTVFSNNLGRFYFIPAPQMHEITPLLPDYLALSTIEYMLVTNNSHYSEELAKLCISEKDSLNKLTN